MMNQRGQLTMVIAIVLLVLFLFGGFGLGLLSTLLINSVIGLLILIILNFLPVIEIPINIWTILIVAIGGVPGIIILIILNVLKLI